MIFKRSRAEHEGTDTLTGAELWGHGFKREKINRKMTNFKESSESAKNDGRKSGKCPGDKILFLPRRVKQGRYFLKVYNVFLNAEQVR